MKGVCVNVDENAVLDNTQAVRESRTEKLVSFQGDTFRIRCLEFKVGLRQETPVGGSDP